MPNNKVQLSDGTVLMDTSGVTVTPEVLMQGYTALDKTGAQITGTATSGGVIVVEEDDEHGGKVVHITGEVIKTQSKTVTPTKATQNVAPDTGYNALSGVTVNPIPDNYIEPSGSLTITENGQHSVSQYASVNVNVESEAAEPVLQTKSVTPTESAQTVVADDGYDGLNEVTVGAVDNKYVGSGITRRNEEDVVVMLLDSVAPIGSAIMTGNSVSVPDGYYENDAVINPAFPNMEVGSATLDQNSNDGTVRVGFCPTVAGVAYTKKQYFANTNVPYRIDTDITVNGNTVSVPNGYYSSQTTKSVAGGSATTPATTITADPTISVSSSGLITATASASQSVTPTVSEGYVSAGTAGTVTVSGSNTQQLTTQGAATITPTKQQQTAVAAGKYTTGAVTVAAIPAEYITTSDATAAAADILSGETAYVNGAKVTGTLDVRHIYVGTGEPSASLGENGDIYLQIGG